MQLARPAFATHPKLFGKGRARVLSEPGDSRLGLSNDLKLFAITFIGGFLFVSILIS